MHHEYWNITKLERYKPSLSRINGGKNVTKKLKDVFYQGSPSLSLFNGMLHNPLFLYFLRASVLLFLVIPSLYDSSVEN